MADFSVLCQCYFGACGLHPGSVPVWVVIVPRKDCMGVNVVGFGFPKVNAMWAVDEEIILR